MRTTLKTVAVAGVRLRSQSVPPHGNGKEKLSMKAARLGCRTSGNSRKNGDHCCVWRPWIIERAGEPKYRETQHISPMIWRRFLMRADSTLANWEGSASPAMRERFG
jgi:hypothetical protein